MPSELTAIIATIRKAAHTGDPGDGKIFAGPTTLACRKLLLTGKLSGG